MGGEEYGGMSEWEGKKQGELHQTSHKNRDDASILLLSS